MEVVYVKEENVSTKDETVVEDEQFLESNSISKTEHQNNKMKKQMSMEETALLIELIQANTTITSKETNAATNRLKEEAWAQLTDSFIAQSGRIRSLNSLKLKWDNLKKAARKRSQARQLESFKSDGGKPNPTTTPDEILDRVDSLLGSTSAAYEIPFIAGDTIAVMPEMDPINFSEDISSTCPTRVSTSSENSGNSSCSAAGVAAPRPPPRQGTLAMARQKKAKRNSDDDTRRELNLAMAAYYRAKTRKLQLECELIKKQMP